MYHRGGDRGWHRGHPQRDIPPPRSHRSRPYRGGYHDHREHDNYGSYHDNSFNEYREHREPVYNRGGRHDGSYRKDTYYRGGYQRGQGEPSRYRGNVPETPHKKYSHKPVKAHKNENEIRGNTSTPQPAQKVIHNPGRTVVTLTPGISEDESEATPSKEKSPEEENYRQVHEALYVYSNVSQNESETSSSKKKNPEDDPSPPQDCEKLSQETAKLANKDVKVDTVIKEEITSPLSDQRNEMLPACNIKTEITESKIEEMPQTEQIAQAIELPTSVNPGKRSHSEVEDFGVSLEQREAESFVVKRLCGNQDRDEEKTDQIPLLGCWGDIPSESVVSASTTEQEHTGSVNFKLPDTAQELRTAFILARKEQIEVAFAQDCKTFSFVASTLLKKDPSMETAVISALRSSLQEMAGLCVQELNNFIDQYDSSVG
ncbi:uncharacterized protein LOC120995103 [Bufo bufo]|uniref:uncharacterized protein LOC120995103 n=1 Tax=Bufo bufo TaxID=8384 RepID=UPI001ABE7EB2|nr:uncharacterized protein LOC120995103 [Bufo bufo]